MTTTRRLAAILAADVAGYSAAMERDEEGTVAAVRALRREVIEPKLAEHQGRLIKTTGDGFLAEFASPIAALKCAIAIQHRPVDSDGLRLRIGLNLGDVIIEEGGDVLGEGVNVAARLEGIAEPGGILVSGKIHSEVEGKVEASFEDRGEQQVKNISRPVRVYAVSVATSPAKISVITFAESSKPLPLPDKPSIAVLPFQNMSGDPEQEYFADGIVEDIITALSRFEQLFVIARNSSFTYKGKAIDIKQVGRELGVRYVLEGSVRKAGGRVRITGQLIEAATNNHLWADKYDGSLEDVFDLQDKLTTSIVLAVVPRLNISEIGRSLRKPTERLDAQDYYWRARAIVGGARRDRKHLEQVVTLCRKAIEIDPTYASAYGLAAQMHVSLRLLGGQSEDELAEGARFARLAVEHGRDNASALVGPAMFYGQALRDVDTAANLVEQAIALNPNAVSAWTARGYINVWLGLHDKAIDYAEASIRLSPLDPSINIFYDIAAWAHFYLSRYEKALALANKALVLQPQYVSSLRVLVASLVQLGRTDEAAGPIARLKDLGAWQRCAEIAAVFTGRSEDIARFVEAIRKAGAPE
jgi:adenylate cyclase